MTNADQTFHVDNHTQSAAHHAAMAGHCKATADAHSALAEHCALTDPTGAKSHRDIAEAYKAMAACHVNEGQRHLDCAKAVGELKTDEIATGSSGEIKALATQVSNLVKYLADPTSHVSPNPMFPSPRPTLAPRFGQNDPRADAVSKVDPGLRHLVDDSNEAAT